MGIKEKLPLLNSGSRIVRLFGLLMTVLTISFAFTLMLVAMPAVGAAPSISLDVSFTGPDRSSPDEYGVYGGVGSGYGMYCRSATITISGLAPPEMDSERNSKEGWRSGGFEVYSLSGPNVDDSDLEKIFQEGYRIPLETVEEDDDGGTYTFERCWIPEETGQWMILVTAWGPYSYKVETTRINETAGPYEIVPISDPYPGVVVLTPEQQWEWFESCVNRNPNCQIISEEDYLKKWAEAGYPIGWGWDEDSDWDYEYTGCPGADFPQDGEFGAICSQWEEVVCCPPDEIACMIFLGKYHLCMYDPEPEACREYLSFILRNFCMSDGGAAPEPKNDSDGDGVLDDIDQCPDTPAKVAVDDKGCPIEMQLIVSTDKKAYSPEETVTILGSVWDAKGGLDGATVAIDVDGTKLTATAYSTEKYMGKYECEFPLPSGSTQSEYTVTATASYSGYPNVSESTTFSVGNISITVKTDDVIPIPGEMPLPIRAMLDEGKPMKGRIVDVQVVDKNGKRISWVSVEQDSKRGSILDENGEIEPILKVREPDGLERPTYLRDWPLKATIKIKISDKEAEKALVEKDIELPFNLALIHGVVVDNKDLKPVIQNFVPDVLGIPELMVFDKEKNLEGDFWVMVRPHHPVSGRPIQEFIDLGNDFALKWDIFDTIPLIYSIEEYPPMPGEVLELGKVGKTPLEKIKEWYIEFGTTPHTWPDGITDKKALTGPWPSGELNNFLCVVGCTECCRFNCVAMQYKTLWFLNNLKNKKADDENVKFLSKLKGWDYSAVSANWFTPGKWPWTDKRTTEHNAVALWDRGKKLWDGPEIPSVASGVTILDPHGKQKPHWYSGDTVLFSWTIDRSYEVNYEDNGWKPPWSESAVVSENMASGWLTPKEMAQRSSDNHQPTSEEAIIAYLLSVGWTPTGELLNGSEIYQPPEVVVAP